MRNFSIPILTVCCFTTAHACVSSSVSQVQRILEESIRLNESFKLAANGSDEAAYRRLRKEVEAYEEATAIPCLRRAATLIREQSGSSLVDSVFAYTRSHENSADETVSRILALLLVERPDIFMVAWKKSARETRKEVLARVSSGWQSIRSKYTLAKRSDIDSRLTGLRSDT